MRFGHHRFKVAGYHSGRFVAPDSEHEQFMGVLIRRLLLERPGAFIDVGVNVGQTFARVLAVEKDRQYLGFEPQLSCCFNVDHFIRINRIANASVIPIALSDSNALKPFFTNGQTDECASLIDDPSSVHEVSLVQCRVGDEVLDELGINAIAAIKIDVEGAEIHVIRGLRDTLRRLRPPVIFEVLPNFFGIGERTRHPEMVCERNRGNADSIAEEFHRVGYRLVQIDESSAEETPIEKFDLDDEAQFRGTSFMARPI